MKAADLKRPSRIFELAELDGGTHTILLSPDKLEFQGTHCAASARLNGATIGGLDKTIGVNGDSLTRALRLLPEDDDITAKLDDKNQLRIRSRRSAFALRTQVASPLEVAKEGTINAKFVVDAKKLREALNILSMVSSTRMDQPAITAAHMILRNGKLRIEATDAVRVAITTIPVSSVEGEFDANVVIADAMLALSFIEGPAVISFLDGRRIRIEGGDVDVWSSLIRGKFPNLSVVPTKFIHEIDLPRDVLTRAVAAAGVFHPDTHIQFNIADGVVSFAAADSEIGEFRILATKKDIPNITITFQAPYLDVASKFSVQKLTLMFNTMRDPILLKGGGWFYWTAPIVF